MSKKRKIYILLILICILSTPLYAQDHHSQFIPTSFMNMQKGAENGHQLMNPQGDRTPISLNPMNTFPLFTLDPDRPRFEIGPGQFQIILPLR